MIVFQLNLHTTCSSLRQFNIAMYTLNRTMHTCAYVGTIQLAKSHFKKMFTIAETEVTPWLTTRTSSAFEVLRRLTPGQRFRYWNNTSQCKLWYTQFGKMNTCTFTRTFPSAAVEQINEFGVYEYVFGTEKKKTVALYVHHYRMP